LSAALSAKGAIFWIVGMTFRAFHIPAPSAILAKEYQLIKQESNPIEMSWRVKRSKLLRKIEPLFILSN